MINLLLFGSFFVMLLLNIPIAVSLVCPPSSLCCTAAPP